MANLVTFNTLSAFMIRKVTPVLRKDAKAQLRESYSLGVPHSIARNAKDNLNSVSVMLWICA